MAKKKTKDKPDPGEQLQIPELEDKEDKAIIRLASRYRARRLERQKASKEEKSAHEALKDLMKEKKIDKYSYHGLQIFIDKQEKVKVKQKGESEVPEED